MIMLIVAVSVVGTVFGGAVALTLLGYSTQEVRYGDDLLRLGVSYVPSYDEGVVEMEGPDDSWYTRLGIRFIYIGSLLALAVELRRHQLLRLKGWLTKLRRK